MRSGRRPSRSVCSRRVTYYNYPKEHWVHLRTTNIVESPFNLVRLCTEASRRFKKVENLECAVALHFMYYNFGRIH